jgi:hypothetical protein
VSTTLSKHPLFTRNPCRNWSLATYLLCPLRALTAQSLVLRGKGKTRAFAVSPPRSRLRQTPFVGSGRYAGGNGSGVRHAYTAIRHRDKTAYWGRLTEFASAVAQPLWLQGSALLHLQAFVGSVLPICFKASLRYAFKPSPLPILALSLEPALAPNQAFPITAPLSDLALASPLRFALRVDIDILCQLPLLRSPKASPFLPTLYAFTSPPVVSPSAISPLRAFQIAFAPQSPSHNSPCPPYTVTVGRLQPAYGLPLTPLVRPLPSVPQGTSPCSGKPSCFRCHFSTTAGS